MYLLYLRLIPGHTTGFILCLRGRADVDPGAPPLWRPQVSPCPWWLSGVLLQRRPGPHSSGSLLLPSAWQAHKPASSLQDADDPPATLLLPLQQEPSNWFQQMFLSQVFRNHNWVEKQHVSHHSVYHVHPLLEPSLETHINGSFCMNIDNGVYHHVHMWIKCVAQSWTRRSGSYAQTQGRLSGCVWTHSVTGVLMSWVPRGR